MDLNGLLIIIFHFLVQSTLHSPGIHKFFLNEFFFQNTNK
jgi:hypothetical protein